MWIMGEFTGAMGVIAPPVISGFRRETLVANYFKGGSYFGGSHSHSEMTGGHLPSPIPPSKSAHDVD